MMKCNEFSVFNKIYKYYWKRLFVFANNMLKDQDACEDIVQDVFTYLYLNRKKLVIANLKPYLFQAVKFQVIKHLRRNKLSQKYIDKKMAVQFTNQTDEIINLKELEFLIKKSLLELPNRCREIFYLSRYEQLSHKQIAAKLNISKQTVKNQVTTALNHLRVKLVAISVKPLCDVGHASLSGTV